MINLTNPGITVVDNTPTINFDRSNAILNAVNSYRYQTNNPVLEPTRDELVQSIKAFATSSKAFTGGSIATGNGLTATNIVAPLYYSDIEGGAFIKSGIDYRPNTTSSITLPTLTVNGGFVQAVCGTPTSNEISLFGRKDLALTWYAALIQGCEDVLARSNNPAELISTFEQVLENQKLILSDTLITQAITAASSGVIAIDPTLVNSVGSIHLNMYKQIGLLGKYTMNGRPNFYMTHSAYIRLLSEQDNTGRFLDCPCDLVKVVASDGSMPTSGLVAYFSGYGVYLVGSDTSKGILETYVTSVSGVITAQTGGVKTIVIFAAPKSIVLIRGRAESDIIRVFNPETDLASFLNGNVTVGARTPMGAGLYNPLRVSYFAI